MPKGLVAARGNRPLVVIDAGHGGHDTGALSVWGNRREKDVPLAIARAVKRELDKSGRVRTVLTRADDRFLVLADRSEVARRLKAIGEAEGWERGITTWGSRGVPGSR